MRLLTNNLIIKDKNEKIYRVLDIDYNEKIVFFINIDGESMPFMESLDDILMDLNEGVLEILDEDIYTPIIREDELNDSEKEYRDKAWKIVSKILKNVNLLNSKELSKCINEISIEYSISKRTIKRYLIKYLIRGQTKNALLPNYYKSGGRNKEKKLNSLKIGAPKKYATENGDGINVTEDIKVIFEKARKTIHNKSTEKKLTTTYQIMIQRYFTNKDGTIKAKEEIPTMKQFRYWYNKNKDIKEEISSRKSKKDYYLNARAILGTSNQDATYPTALFQIDSTQGDVYLVSSYNRNNVIGRPTIYIIIDVFSRMVTGFYAGIESASWCGAMMAIYNCTVNKVKFCRQYGIDIEEKDWNSSKLPEAILGDRGTELTGKNIETLVNTFRVDVKNTAPYRADLKGIVERLFRELNSKFKEFIPGAIDSGFRKRGEKDYRKYATLDIYEINRVIIKCILNHNSQFMNTYKRDEVMVQENVKTIPTELWDWGMRKRVGYKPDFAEDIIKLALMPLDQATVTERGIKFKNMYYVCDTAIEKQWLSIARISKKWKIDISYDPRNVNHIYLRRDDGKSYEICRLKESESRYFDKELDDVTSLIESEKKMIAENEYEKLLKNIDTNKFIESEVKIALSKNKTSAEDKGKNTKKISGIRENRSKEREMNRKIESFDLNKDKNMEYREHYQENLNCLTEDILFAENKNISINKDTDKNYKNKLRQKMKKYQEERLYD